ncbi:MAG: GatB/YqeY domain-containing protein [Gammaproteobacteria bacterium]
MSKLKTRINEEIKECMRNKDKERLLTLRMITAAIKQKEVDERIELDDGRILAILDKMARQHRDSIQQYENAGRQDLVDKENLELGIVESFLPEQLGEEEITRLIQATIEKTGATSIKDMGKVMGILKPELQGRTDMARVSDMVKTLLV